MERSEILQKLAAGAIGVDEAEQLLRESRAEPEAAAEHEALDREEAEPEAQETPDPKSEGAKDRPRWLHVHVSDAESRRERIRINIPIGVVQAGLRFGSRLGCGLTGDMWEDVMDALRHDEQGTLVEVEEHGERVHIFVD